MTFEELKNNERALKVAVRGAARGLVDSGELTKAQLAAHELVHLIDLGKPGVVGVRFKGPGYDTVGMVEVTRVSN